ncbi:MAG: hypothetical protein F8N37_07405 [Telmatospirillum sp.]|nr:hypothetical protein [Telmatospirillum sp.]
MTGVGGHARADDSTDVRTRVFVATGNRIAVIDSRTNQSVDTLDVGLTPRLLALTPFSSPSPPVLAAADGRSGTLVLLDPGRKTQSRLTLTFPIRRIALSGDGTVLAASDLEGGHVALVRLADRHPLAAPPELGPVSDFLFVGDDATLAIAGERGTGLHDPRTGAWTPINVPPANLGRAPVLARSANGRRLFLRSADGGPVAIAETPGGRLLAPLPARPGAGLVTPSATGAYLLLTDERRHAMTIVHGDDLTPGADLPGATGMGRPYSGWFDSVAFVPTADSRLLIYDLWRLSVAGEIALPSPPGPGAVTADGSRLYLPLGADRSVAVIDTRTRRMVGRIVFDAPTEAVIVGGAYGLCH